MSNNKKTYKCEKERIIGKKENKCEEYECCVICGAVTSIPVSLPINIRVNYVVGCGQLCEECGNQYIDN